MKNQYFGDRNDYFKFDLLAFLCDSLPGVQRLTVLWLLTQDDGSGDGRKVG
jgi:hypothetical protein